MITKVKETGCQSISESIMLKKLLTIEPIWPSQYILMEASLRNYPFKIISARIILYLLFKNYSTNTMININQPNLTFPNLHVKYIILQNEISFYIKYVTLKTHKKYVEIDSYIKYWNIKISR